MTRTVLAMLLVMLGTIKTTTPPAQALQRSIDGVFEGVGMKSSKSILQCLDESSIVEAYDVVNEVINVGAESGIADVQRIPQTLRYFYNCLPDESKQCLDRNEDLLKLSYYFGIGYLPLAERTYRTYVRENFLKVSQQYEQLRNFWAGQIYQVGGRLLVDYGQTLFPIKKLDIRGVWLTNVASDVLNSREQINEAVEQCHRAGINSIFVVVYNNARTIYQSQTMYNLIGVRQAEAYIGRNPLEEVVEAAHAKQIKVYAWFEFGFSSSYSSQGGPIIARRPGWKALNSAGELVVKNGFDWLNGFDPQVQNFMLDFIYQVLVDYDVDGIQGDDRLPALPSTAGYETYTINLYKSEHEGNSPPSDHLDEDWVNWRVGKLNAYMRRLYHKIKEFKMDALVIMAPSPYPWSKQEYLQDWPTWARNNWIDGVIPQCYRYDLSAYTSVLKQQLALLTNPKPTFVPGVLLNVGNYTADTTLLTEVVKTNRQLGVTGQTFFFYEGVVKQRQWFEKEYRSIGRRSQLTVQTIE